MPNLEPLLTEDHEIIECHQGHPTHEANILKIEHPDGSIADVFSLERANWNGAKHPDGLIIGQDNNKTWWVCFVEMKFWRNNHPDNAKNLNKAKAQLENAIQHYCFHQRCTPTATMPTSGDTHHQNWLSGTDRLPNLPSRDHKVAGTVVFIWRRGPRHRLPPLHLEVTCHSKPVRERILLKPFHRRFFLSICEKDGFIQETTLDDLIK